MSVVASQMKSLLNKSDIGGNRKSLREQVEKQNSIHMKKFVKSELIAKNLPTGSYAAGCPANFYQTTAPKGKPFCSACEKKN